MGPLVRGWGMEGSNESIYNKHRDDLVRYAASLVGADHAEDIVSTVVLRVLARNGLVGLDDPKPYLFRAVLNEARSLLRKSDAVSLLDSRVEFDVPDIDLWDAVMRLPARQRAALYLVFVEGDTVNGAASLMGCAGGTVKRYLHLAKRRLKESM